MASTISVPFPDCPPTRPAMSTYGATAQRTESADSVTTLLGDDSDSASSSSARAHAKTPLLGSKGPRRRLATGLRARARAIRRLQCPPALELVNSGSVARDHLASERTFLAYVRTSLGIASMGIALVQLFRMAPPGAGGAADLALAARALGAVLVSTGLCTLALGVVRYFAVQRALIDGKFPVARVGLVLLAVTLALCVVVVFALLLGVRAA